ncbi:uncharacterized protein LOC129722564 [Wyeomyia smithii]|uniref:uncharacterized protein LOC129722564 n=1 Tax=Wyeomyia smithii TaxID=174621 RepID=UPI002467CBEC|nr:uncharacterized protein LOC129722564 [Wyeomyia smithii]
MATERHINDLPSEMVGRILDYLSFGERKVAALVCQRWNEEVFSTCFLDRVLFRVFPDQSAVVCKSVRIYRHMQFCKMIRRDWSAILSVLDKFGPQLYSLHVNFYTTPQLWELYRRTQHLKQLTLEVSCKELIFEEEFLPRWDDVEEFTLNYNTSDEMGIEFQFLTPNISRLTMEWRSESFLGESLDVLQRYARKLTYLDLGEIKPGYDELDEDSLQQFFSVATELQTALIRFQISPQIFKTIAKSCKHLRMLFFCTDLLKTSDLSVLDELTELKVLRIRSKELLQIAKVSHKPLPNVDTLCLQLDHNPSISAIEYLGKRLPNIHTLKVMIGSSRFSMGVDVLNQICYSFRRLKTLTVNDRSYLNPLPMEGFNQLRHLHRLEELNLTNVELSISKLPTTNIRRLRLNRCKFETNQWANLAKVMPCLQYLGFRESGFVKGHLSAAALALPNCTVEMCDYYLYRKVMRIFFLEI